MGGRFFVPVAITAYGEIHQKDIKTNPVLTSKREGFFPCIQPNDKKYMNYPN
jgi:hypothetical protein